jgi:hypothetical protein
MRKIGYVLADNFPPEVRSTIEKTIGNYKEVDKVISKANDVLKAAKSADKFKEDQEIEKMGEH